MKRVRIIGFLCWAWIGAFAWADGFQAELICARLLGWNKEDSPEVVKIWGEIYPGGAKGLTGIREHYFPILIQSPRFGGGYLVFLSDGVKLLKPGIAKQWYVSIGAERPARCWHQEKKLNCQVFGPESNNRDPSIPVVSLTSLNAKEEAIARDELFARLVAGTRDVVAYYRGRAAESKTNPDPHPTGRYLEENILESCAPLASENKTYSKVWRAAIQELHSIPDFAPRTPAMQPAPSSQDGGTLAH